MAKSKEPWYIITSISSVTPKAKAPLYYQGKKDGFSWYLSDAKRWRESTARKHLQDETIQDLRKAKLIKRVKVIQCSDSFNR